MAGAHVNLEFTKDAFVLCLSHRASQAKLAAISESGVFIEETEPHLALVTSSEAGKQQRVGRIKMRRMPPVGIMRRNSLRPTLLDGTDGTRGAGFADVGKWESGSVGAGAGGGAVERRTPTHGVALAGSVNA